MDNTNTNINFAKSFHKEGTLKQKFCSDTTCQNKYGTVDKALGK